MDSSLVGFVSLLILMLVILILLIVLVVRPISIPRSNYVLIDEKQVPTNRNGETHIDYLVSYRQSHINSVFPENVKATVNRYLNIVDTDEFTFTSPIPYIVTWDEIVELIIDKLYEISGIKSVTLQIKYKEGEMSAISSKGYIEPLRK